MKWIEGVAAMKARLGTIMCIVFGGIVICTNAFPLGFDDIEARAKSAMKKIEGVDIRLKAANIMVPSLSELLGINESIDNLSEGLENGGCAILS